MRTGKCSWTRPPEAVRKSSRRIFPLKCLRVALWIQLIGFNDSRAPQAPVNDAAPPLGCLSIRRGFSPRGEGGGGRRRGGVVGGGWWMELLLVQICTCGRVFMTLFIAIVIELRIHLLNSPPSAPSELMGS